MQFQSTARATRQDVGECYNAGEPIKLFREDHLWSVECSRGLLYDFGTDRFADLESLLDSLKDQGLEKLTLHL